MGYIVLGLFVLFISVFALSVAGQEHQEKAVGFVVTGAAILPLAVMAWNGSRAASMAMVAWFVLNAILQDRFGLGLIIPILHVAATLLLTWHAFAYWRTCRQEEQTAGGSSLLRWLGWLVPAPVMLLAMIGMAADQYMIDPDLMESQEILPEYVQWMREKGLLVENERPLMLYADGVLSLDEGGNVLTDKYVGSWWTEDGEIESGWVRLGEVCRVERSEENSGWGETAYTFHGLGAQNWIELYLPDQTDAARRFFDKFHYLNALHMDTEIEAACTEDRPVDWQKVAVNHGIPSAVISGSELSRQHLNWLRGQKFLLVDEKPLFFYSYGIYEISEGGSLLTDQYFGGWAQERDGVEDWWSELGDICSIEEMQLDEEPDPTEPKLDSRYYRVTTPDDGWFEVRLSPEDEYDRDMIEKARELVRAAQTPAQIRACTAPDEEAGAVTHSNNNASGG